MAWLKRLRGSLRGARLERDLADELAFHVDMKTRELVEAGMDPGEARREARRRFGNATLARERTRDMDILPALEALWRDLRLSLRALARSRTFTAVVVLTLALGIGANVAVFGVVDEVLLRPYAFPGSQDLVLIFTEDVKGREDFDAYADLEDWRRQSRTLERLTAYVPQSVNLTGEREPERLVGAFATADIFPLLGLKAALGRTLQPADDAPGAPPVVVASHGLWQNRYGGAADFLGRKLVLNGSPFTVVGVLPAGFHFPWADCDVWIPYRNYPNYRPGERGGTDCAVLGHIRPGVTLEQAQAEMSTIARRLATQYPATNHDRGVRLKRFQPVMTKDVRPTLLLLWGAVAFVFLIACANAANLALARVLARRREMGIRAALGGSRLDLLRQLLVEHVLLAVAGGGLGLLLGHWGMRLLAAVVADALPDGTLVGLTPAGVALGLALALAAGLLCGLLPASQALRAHGSAWLHDGGRALSDGREHALARRVLVVAQAALCLVLLAGAGLLLRSLLNVSRIDPGFRTRQVLTMEYRVPRNRYPTPEQQWAFHWRVIQRIREVPGVRSASALLALPFSGNGGDTSFVLPDRPEPPRGAEPRALVNRVAPQLFEALGIPLLRGRYPDERDRPGALPVAVISRTFAERYFTGQDPVGRQVRLPEFRNTVVTVVGVVGDIRHYSLLDRDQVQIYVPFAQQPHIFSTLVVHTAGDPMSLASAVRRAVWSVDKDQPVWKVRTLESMVARYLSWRGWLPKLISAFAGFALLLAALGIYGVVSYSTARRTREFGLRIAVGAGRRDVLALVLGDGLRMTALAVVLGTAGALSLARLLKGQLYGVSEADPLTFLAVAVVLAAVALLASYLPARHALRIDPVRALRHE